MGPQRLVVWLNEPSNLTVVTRARRAEFPTQFVSALEALLVRLGIPGAVAAEEATACSTFTLVKARDRSLLGSLRDAMLRVRWHIEDGDEVVDIENGMAEMPARQKAFLVPREVVFARLNMERPPRSPWPPE